MKKILFRLSVAMLIIGLSTMAFASYRIKEAEKEVFETLITWEANKIEIEENHEIGSNNSDSDVLVKESNQSAIYTAGDMIATLTFEDQVIPILTGRDEDLLKSGALHYDTTPFPGASGNSIILGHRDGVFRNLRILEINDTFVMNFNHQMDHYQVIDIKILKPDDLSVFDSYGFPTISLETCYPFSFFGPAPERYIVVGKKIESTPN